MGKINLYDTIVGPVITEKSTNLSSFNKVVFKVIDTANKKNLKKKYRKLKFTNGGETRLESSYFGLLKSDNCCINVLIHFC